MKLVAFFLKLGLATLIMVIIANNAFSQGVISGTVYDAQKNALPLCTIQLTKAADSAVVKAGKADLLGHFKMQDVPSGNYRIVVSMMGFKTKFIDGIMIDASHSIVDLGDLQVEMATKELAQVVVVSKKNLIEQRIDRTIVNVENSILAGGSTALEILEKAPGVVVDHQSDQIRLNNKSGVTVMIDGRKSFLSSADLANLLKGMSSDQIGTIEIISNPSSKYDASGNAGIIDIKLKKSKFYGTNGSISANVGNGIVPYGDNDLFRESLNLSLNNRTERFNIFGNLYQNRTGDYNQTQLERTVLSGSSESRLSQFITTPRIGTGLSARLGADYSLNSKTTIGVLLEGNKANDDIKGVSNISVRSFDSLKDSAGSALQNSMIRAPRHDLTANFNIKHDLAKPGESLSFDATYSGFKNKRDQDFNTSYFDSSGKPDNTVLQRNFTNSNIDILTSRIDLTLMFKNELRFETGLKQDYVRTENNYNFQKLDAGEWVDIAGQSNLFIYKEYVTAGYVNFYKKWKKLSVQAGLRAEQTFTNGNSVTVDSVVKRDYISLFPSVFVSQDIDENNTIRYSYSRRIDRPNYQQLNPFVFYEDPYTLDEGNPFLKPQFSDNFELSYTYKGLATLSLRYSNTKDYIVQITEQDNATKVITAIVGNLGNYKNYAANLSFPITISDWWMMQNQFNLYYNKYEDGDLLGGQFNSGKLAYNLNLYQSFKISSTWGAELSFAYVAPYVYGMERTTRSRYGINAGVQKSFANNRARIKLNVSDIFLNQQYTGILKYQNIDMSILNKWTSRRAALTFTYNFGKQTIKASRDRSTGAEDLKNRVTTKD